MAKDLRDELQSFKETGVLTPTIRRLLFEILWKHVFGSVK
jgi:hypothetical protein